MCAPFICSSSDAVAECICTSALVTLLERHAICPVLWPPAGEVSGAPEVVARPCEGAEARQDVELLHSIWLQRLWMDVEGTYETCHYPPRTPTSPCHRDPLHRINRTVRVPWYHIEYFYLTDLGAGVAAAKRPSLVVTRTRVSPCVLRVRARGTE